ncbi:TIGR01620 family protein [Rhodobaculum claviforme]|uniref:TIGR01620 family protein n=1 Tax=Rhodobaculum claviforme TaxID=1549854 RepID=A0A934TI93_9RHOB|nr:TIGR01620 family protein [Rhodobaculum claviforme]MBK5926046.1 TIGR01620 family protein [Rhodobaculum claviforme]
MTPPRGPILFEIDDDGTSPGPADAPPILDAPDTPAGAAMQAALRIGARRMSLAARAVLSALGALVAMALGLAAWDWVMDLLTRVPVLGMVATALVGLLLLGLVALALREGVAIRRLRRLDALRRGAEAALQTGDAAQAARTLDSLSALYAGRADMARACARLAERRDDHADAGALLALAEAELLTPLDAAARREVEAAARLVATVTAVVPLALADVAAALVANLRMIRRVAEIYGGRSGVLGNWRLTRAVLTHLVATGAVAVGDDLVGTVAGGGMLARVSRRFGEGVVNGALTARVGVAAIEVCRPLPFRHAPGPRVTALVRRALTGLFDRA